MDRARWIAALCVGLCWGCGGESEQEASGGAGGAGATGGGTSGCSQAPACGSCQGCYETCVCEGGDSSACVDKCQTGTGGAAGSGGVGGSSGSGGSGGGTGGSAGDTVTIKTTPRSVAPGEEVFFCQNLSNPFGQDVDVLSSESFMTPGSHHMFVFYEPGAQDGPVHDCSGLEYKRTLHGAQTPQHIIQYPEGVGKHVSTSTGLRVLAHYLNTTNQVINAEITVVFKIAPGGTVAQQAGSVFFLNPGIYVGPYQTGQASDSCYLNKDINIIEIVSHMHQFGTSFSAKTDKNQVVYETTDWAEPEPAVFKPPMQVSQGSTITYTCEYKNTLKTALTFGESAIDNEMCILSGTYYPAPNGATLGCN